MPIIIAAFIARIAFLRPKETILPPKKLPIKRPTMLEFDTSVVYSLAYSESQPNFFIKTGAV